MSRGATRRAGRSRVRARAVAPHRAHRRRGVPILRGPVGAGVGIAAGVIAGLVAGVVGIGAATAPASAGTAYRFSHPGFAVRGEEGARRWADDAWPVRYRVLENANLEENGNFESADAWREFLAAAMGQWNAVETAEIALELEETAAEQDAGIDADGINTIGFSSVFAEEEVPAAGFASWDFSGGALQSCDVELNPEVFRTGAPQYRLDRLTALVLHEIGHCLGLLHTVVLPMPFYAQLTEVDLTGFQPDPTMSYGRDGPFLMPDDEIAVSLLYPAPGFRASTGALSGTIRFEGGGPARFAYVQAVEVGEEDARAGPGAFADSDGVFLLEGVRPGPVLLWVHPMLILGAHFFPGEWALSFQDQWLWAEVTAGGVTAVPEISVFRGRGAAR